MCEWTKSALALLCVSIMSAGGCGSGQSPDAFAPPASSATAAVEAALNQWKNGQPMAKLTALGVSVEPVDNEWSQGIALKTFQIDAAKTAKSGNATKVPVTLTLGEGQSKQVDYVVFGIDPLYVYREEDYTRTFGEM